MRPLDVVVIGAVVVVAVALRVGLPILFRRSRGERARTSWLRGRVPLWGVVLIGAAGLALILLVDRR